jgi:hypothetical protein
MPAPGGNFQEMAGSKGNEMREATDMVMPAFVMKSSRTGRMSRRMCRCG